MEKSVSLMEVDLAEASAVVARQSNMLAKPLVELVSRLRNRPPNVVVTCARGSSGHAANFGKYLIERHLGIPVAAFAPSLATVYRRSLQLKNQLFLTISQSGQSDDLVEAASWAKASGALTVGIVNDVGSPLASVCDTVLPMGAGRELSVAATKTFIASSTALFRLTTGWVADEKMDAALDRLPKRLALASQLNWSKAADALVGIDKLAILGRGPTLAIAHEAALKFKEVCNIQAEAFSGAEFQHGPISLVSKSYPVLAFMPTDEAASHLSEVVAEVRRKTGRAFVTGSGLPALAPDHPDTDALCLIQSLYVLSVRLAELRGLDPDRPRHLEKITITR
jgi:glucosamine--fructose-6-phosphate aminotransferase (isomerizing)